jgi:hypothetical protein
MRKGSAARVLALVAASWILTAGSAGSDEGRVDLLLVLAADVSRSVNEAKFKLQREGYATAITDARVLRAISEGEHRRIGIIYVEWASEFEQKVIVDWTIVSNEHDAKDLSGRILAAPRSFWGRTSISAAIEYGLTTLERSPFLSDRQVIDVSGDGTNNSGGDVTAARDDAVKRGITINGLVILSDEPLVTNPKHTHPEGGLTAYYENNVIGGPGAFVIEAENFESFGRLLVSKLIREIASLPLPSHTALAVAGSVID